MGTVYPTLELDWVTPADREGKRHFLIYAKLDNYNDTSIVLNKQYITTPIWSGEVHLTKICIIHQGTVGVSLATSVAANKPDAASATAYIATPVGQVITISADDHTIYEGDWRLDPGDGSTSTSAIQFLVTTAAGYAATDDIRFILEGWYK